MCSCPRGDSRAASCGFTTALAGLASARTLGRKGGRPRVMTAVNAKMASMLRQYPNRTVREICEALGYPKLPSIATQARPREPAYPPTTAEVLAQAVFRA